MSVDLSILPDGIRPTAESLMNKFKYEKYFENGSNGYVLVGINKITDQRIVVKFYYWGEGSHLEPKFLCKLDSPYILPVLDASAINKDDAYFVTKYCEYGDLHEYIERGCIGVLQAVDIITGVANGVNDIHSANLIHRDLKPSNIFCASENRFVIGDFGSVVERNDQGYAETTSKHSLLYRTPEETTNGRAYPQGDIYQIGMILFQMLGGRLPYIETEWLTVKELAIYHTKPQPENQFYANSVIENKIKIGKLLDYSSLPSWIPSSLIRVVRKCCRMQISDRYNSASELIVDLSNLRSSLPDWRLEPDPILYKSNGNFRLVESGAKYLVEKKVGEHSAWRKQKKHPAMSLAQAVKLVENL